MDTMSVEDAARRLGVSTKTIYRYLEKKKLTSTKMNEVHYIPTEQVEKLAVSRHVQEDVQTYLKQRVDTLHALFQAHDFRLKELEEKVRALQAHGHVETVQEPHQEPAQETDLPSGTLTMQEFATQLGIARKTLLDSVLKYDLPHTAIPNPTRPREMKRSFTPEQQSQIIAWRKSH